jgi:acyl transferase domain-containing protein
MFSGAGSHYYDMGRAYYDNEPQFRQHMQRMDAIVHALCGRSIIETLYGGAHKRGDTFEGTLLTSLSIFMVEVALARTLISEGTTPDLVLGTSMGSFAAASIAGCVELEDVLRFIVRQSRILESSCRPGAMIAVLDDPRLHEEGPIADNADIASLNCPSHFVVACANERVQAIQSFLDKRQVAWSKLGVSLPFHSRWIQDAAEPFAELMKSLPFRPPRVPLVCCAAAQALSVLPADFFWQVVRRPILFEPTVTRLEASDSYQYIDVGPSGTLATFLKYCLKPTSVSTVQITMSPFGNELRNLAAVVGRA